MLLDIKNKIALDRFMFIMVISPSIRCGVEQWQLVGLITRRSQVQVLSPLLKRERLYWSLSFILSVYHHAQSGAVLIPAIFPTRLYIVTLVNGSPRMPS